MSDEKLENKKCEDCCCGGCEDNSFEKKCADCGADCENCADGKAGVGCKCHDDDVTCENCEGCDDHPCGSKSCEAEKVELTQKWMRAVADFHNLERRVNSDLERIVKLSNKAIWSSLLELLDSIDMALAHEIDHNGLKALHKQFQDILERNSITATAKIGEEFDANLHEAIELGEGEKEKITKIIKQGYALNGESLRIAQVVVGAGIN